MDNEIARHLPKLLEPYSEIGITTHMNPDPDGLSSGFALFQLLKHLFPDKPVLFAYSGVIGRVENRVLVKECAIPLTPWDRLDQSNNRGWILVDCQFPQKYHPLQRPPILEIDHHEQLDSPLAEKAQLSDIRPEYGATATIICKYCQEWNLTITPILSTALVYGIKTDTQDLFRTTLDEEYQIYFQLLKNADRTKLQRIIHAPVGIHFYRSCHQALKNSFFMGQGILFTFLEEMEYPDLPAQIAEFFSPLENARMVVAMGFWRDTLYVSLRSKDPKINGATVLKEVLKDMGQGGGHGRMAGGQIPLFLSSDEEKKSLRERVLKEFATYFGLDMEKDRLPLF